MMFAASLLAMAARPARAQCADGSPPPCAVHRPAPVIRTPRAPDPNVIAILPFRVTTTDTLLGEGFAELLATEFTGQGAPRAIDMGTVLSEWRRAGGGPRTPLTRERALAVARTLGAGLLTEGSIVGLGRQITVTANLVTVPTGSARDNATRVNTPADSVDLALRQTAASLIAALGGQTRINEGDGARYTDSPVAMRLYLQGLSAWRRGQFVESADAFDRAIALDSAFSQALFRRHLAQRWNVAGGVSEAMLWSRRMKLSPRERAVTDMLLGSSFPRRRTQMDRVLEGERAATAMGDSPEVMFWAGDGWYHWGTVVDPVHNVERARDYMSRALAVDSQTTTLRHLVEIAIHARDTAFIKQVMPPYLRTSDQGRWPAAWLAAATTGDVAALARLRRSVDADSRTAIVMMSTTIVAALPAALLDEMYARWRPTLSTPLLRALLDRYHALSLLTHGRPAEAEGIIAQLPERERADVDAFRVAMALAHAGDGITVEPIVARLDASVAGDSLQIAQACLAALWRLHRGDRSVETDRFRAFSPNCAFMMDLARLPRDSSAATIAAISAADSSVRANLPQLRGFEPYLLAGAWQAAGQPQRALDAIRQRLYGLGATHAPWNYVEEGRLAAIAGDTLGAVRAYRLYLDLTADAEPALDAKRARARAELARLIANTR